MTLNKRPRCETVRLLGRLRSPQSGLGIRVGIARPRLPQDRIGEGLLGDGATCWYAEF